MASKRKLDLHEYVGMPGTTCRLKGPLVSTMTEAMRFIKKYPVVSLAGDHGSILLYHDADKQLRATFCRFLSIKVQETFPTQQRMKEWLKEHIPMLREAP